MPINKQLEKTPMPEQNPKIRAGNFDEVALGYDLEMAVNEANRCLQCRAKPCVKGCPVSVSIPEFIEQLAKEDLDEAYKVLSKNNVLPAICGRVCPQEKQCEARCVRGVKGESVAIGRLERFVADYAMANNISAEDDAAADYSADKIKVGVIGSGPAGLTCAGELAKKGYDVTVFEALHKPGGVLTYGIPDFRLPERIVSAEIEKLKALGVKIETNSVIGRLTTLGELEEQGFKAFFIGSGAGLPVFMNIEGEGLPGVMSSNEFLTRVNLMKAYDDEYHTPIHRAENVVVVGGGNVAMDAARSALRLGAKKVTIVYRRTEDEMPARLEEIHHAKEEGVNFEFLTNPVKVKADGEGNAAFVECVKMALGEPDKSGRPRPVTLEGSNFDIKAEMVIIAIGSLPNPIIKLLGDVELSDRGYVKADETSLRTSKENVFAGGDIVTGAATVIMAMGAGKTAARSMDDYLKSI